MLSKPSLARGVLWTVIAVAAPTGLRWLIDSGGTTGTPFVTFYPAILLASLFLGWRYGIATAVLTGIVVNRFLRYKPLDFSLPSDVLIIALFALTCSIMIYIAAMVRRLLNDEAEAARREALLNVELLHRVKNMLATVSSIATMTVRHSDPTDFIDAFDGRIAALSRASELLAVGKEVQCEMGRLVGTAIEPFRTGGNIEVDGPDIELPRESCMPLSLALYELCTNATKYGALSVPDGIVKLAWDVGPEGRLQVAWREENGPPVPEKRRQGMGSRLLQAQTGLDAVRLEFWREGVSCEIEIKLGETTSG